MKILLYYQGSAHTVFLESLLQGFVDKGHETFLLTTSAKGVLHEIADKLGVRVYSAVDGTGHDFSYFKNVFFLVKFCNHHKIDVIYSHLQNANLIALISGYFIKAKIFPCRHHIDEVLLTANRNGILIDKMVNFLSKKMVVVSKQAKSYMAFVEKVNPDKIIVIPLGYNFTLYDKPDYNKVADIREENACKLLLIVVARMQQNKRHILALKALKKLKDSVLDVKMIIMDYGPEMNNLVEFVNNNDLINNVKFTGFITNISDYLQAADVLVCPSIIESSNQVVKEAGMLSKSSIVVSTIGDFDEYIVHGKNSFLISKENSENDLVELISDIYYNKYELDKMGELQKQIIYDTFDIKKVVEQYLNLYN